MWTRKGFLLIVVAIVVLIPSFVQASWWGSFCERYLVAEDPYPFAEFEFPRLIELYTKSHNTKILDEILFRYRSHSLNQTEQQLFWSTFR